jgi:hypothetical protein
MISIAHGFRMLSHSLVGITTSTGNDFIVCFYFSHLLTFSSVVVSIFWILVVLASLFSRLLSARRPTKNSKVTSRPQHSRKVNGPWLWFKRHVTIPAAFGYRCSQSLGWITIPPRIQSLTILAFVILNIIFCIHGYRITSENL